MGKFYADCAEALINHLQFWTWLNTPPTDKKKDITKGLTRLQKKRDELGDELHEPDMPGIEGFEHVLEHLWDCGPALGGSMGAGPLTHLEIAAWQANTGIEIGPWEARMLRRLSIEYLDWSRKAADPDCPSPLTPPELTAEERVSVSSRVQNAFRALMGGDSK